jgi:hypothetical protein
MEALCSAIRGCTDLEEFHLSGPDCKIDGTRFVGQILGHLPQLKRLYIKGLRMHGTKARAGFDPLAFLHEKGGPMLSKLVGIVASYANLDRSLSALFAESVSLAPRLEMLSIASSTRWEEGEAAWVSALTGHPTLRDVVVRLSCGAHLARSLLLASSESGVFDFEKIPCRDLRKAKRKSITYTATGCGVFR